MVRDGHVDDPTAVVREDDEHEQERIGESGHDEEVSGHDLAGVVGQEGAP